MALGEVLPLSRPQFLCEEPALALRRRSWSPSLSTSQVCGPEPWVAQRDCTLWPSCGCAWGVLLEQPDVIRRESLGSSGNLQLWP